jgi:hypothetical protein
MAQGNMLIKVGCSCTLQDAGRLLVPKVETPSFIQKSEERPIFAKHRFTARVGTGQKPVLHCLPGFDPSYNVPDMVIGPHQLLNSEF